ncbi:uncharacterized protein [Clytia hemisphaerica]|uniref:Uncharacterized protein n=1 Tax=Clytia hemisphaerica TaxID=252671 RepID=A0A7M5UBK0_9CNID
MRIKRYFQKPRYHIGQGMLKFKGNRHYTLGELASHTLSFMTKRLPKWYGDDNEPFQTGFFDKEGSFRLRTEEAQVKEQKRVPKKWIDGDIADEGYSSDIEEWDQENDFPLTKTNPVPLPTVRNYSSFEALPYPKLVQSSFEAVPDYLAFGIPSLIGKPYISTPIGKPYIPTPIGKPSIATPKTSSKSPPSVKSLSDQDKDFFCATNYEDTLHYYQTLSNQYF